MTRTMQGVEDFLRLDMAAAAAAGGDGGAGVADCVEESVFCFWLLLLLLVALADVSVSFGGDLTGAGRS